MTSETTTFKKTTSKINALLGWTRSSYYLLGAFLLTCFLIIYIWWPLAEEYLAQVPWDGEWWPYIDWLLLGNFAFMSLMLMAGADIRKDLAIVFVGFWGGLVIESWGTQTHIWTYYTLERPPLWIIPAWPIASLAIDRMVRLAHGLLPKRLGDSSFRPIYWLTFALFSLLMIQFVSPTLDKSLTVLALIMCALMIASPKDYRIAVLTFAMGTGLGYFLELWGTTRLCWTYYTLEQPPVFPVLAHGMAAVAFWRAKLLGEILFESLKSRLSQERKTFKVAEL